MGQTFRRQGLDVEYFAYDTSGAVPIDELGGQLARRIFEIQRQDQAGSVSLVHVVAFSMGGLVTRAAVLLHGARLQSAVFLNSPHQGSLNAWLLPHIPAVRQMVPGSDFLRKINAFELPCPTMAVWCPGDLMVVPGSSARLPRATRTVCCKVPLHVWPLISVRLQRVVYRFVRRCEALQSVGTQLLTEKALSADSTAAA